VFLTFGIESAMAPGARTGSAMRPGRKSGAGRPTLGRWCLLEARANSGERAGGRSASTSPPAPSRSSPVVPFACHIQGSIRYAADNHGHSYAADELVVLAGPARTHPANVPDKDELPGSSPARPTTPGVDLRKRSLTVSFDCGGL
jgi:hypothetical protein